MASTLRHEADHLPTTPTVAEQIAAEVARGERTLTPLGRILLEARRQIELAGELAENQDELDREKKERRGGVEGLS